MSAADFLSDLATTRYSIQHAPRASSYNYLSFLRHQSRHAASSSSFLYTVRIGEPVLQAVVIFIKELYITEGQANLFHRTDW